VVSGGRGFGLRAETRRADGTTPCDNFVCFRCQKEAEDLREVDRAVDQYAQEQYAKRRGGLRLGREGFAVEKPRIRQCFGRSLVGCHLLRA
jgi:hypothetical protein